MTDNVDQDNETKPRAGRVLGGASGFGPAARSAKAPFSVIGKVSQHTFRTAGAVFRRSETPSLPTKSGNARERFLVAQGFYGRSDADVARIERASGRLTYVWLFIAIALTFWALRYASGANYGNGFLNYIFPWVAHLFVVPKLIQSAFWNWQLRTRALGSFHEFRQKPGEWLPPIGKTIARALCWTVIFALALQPVTAMAQSSEMFEFLGRPDPDTDVFYQLLQMIAPVGPVEVGVYQSPWTGPISEAFRVFNGALLSVGAAMLGWHTMSGMIATAHEGKVLGQKWHQIWAPVRVTFGVGTLVPAAGGFAAIQLLVLSLAVWGGQLANITWSAFLNTFHDRDYMTSLIDEPGTRSSYAAAIRDIGENTQAEEFIEGFLGMQVCLRTTAEAFQKIVREYETDYGEINQPLEMVDERTWAAIKNRATRAAPRLFGDISQKGGGSSVGVTELMGGDLKHEVGVSSSSGMLVIDTELSGGLLSRDTQKLKGSPVVFWDGGYCGRAEINAFDLDLVKAAIASHPATQGGVDAHTSLWGQAGKWIGRSDEAQAELDAADEDAAFQRHALEMILQTSDRIGEQMDQLVMPYFYEAARLIDESIGASYAETYREAGSEGAQQAGAQLAANYERLIQEDLNIFTLVGRAYQGYTDIIEIERSRAAESVYELYDNGGGIDSLLEMAEGQGWAAAGTYFAGIARIQDINYNLDRIEASFNGGFQRDPFIVSYRTARRNMDVAKPRDDIAKMFLGGGTHIGAIEQSQIVTAATGMVFSTNDVLDDFESAVEGAGQNPDGELSVWDDYVLNVPFSGDGQGPWEVAREKIYEPLSTSLYNFTFKSHVDPRNPLVDMQEFGQGILKGAGATLAVVTIGEAIAGGGVKKAMLDFAGIGKIISMLLFVMKTVLIILVAIGLTHTFILPMVPYIMMVFFVLGYLILVAEALVAAPIWALWHVRMDGSEFVDQAQRPGYMIAFNLFLRPVLAIFGLIMAFAVFSASILFLDETFKIAGRMTMAEGVGLIGVLSMLCILTYCHYQVAIRSFSLITQLPDRVVRWFGQGGENLGEENDAKNTIGLFVGHSENKISGMANAAGARQDGGGRAEQDEKKPSDVGGAVKEAAEQADESESSSKSGQYDNKSL